MMSTEDVERIRCWHERAYREARAEAGEGQTFEYLGRTLVVPPDVHPITGVSHLLGQAVLDEVRDGDQVLDMGTGSGVNAILAASKAAYVLAVDVNPEAVSAARRNAERNGVADIVEVRHSDVFAAVDGEFDLVIFDPPFRWFAPRDLLEMGSSDENYRAMTAFFGEVRAHLSARGRMLIFFGTSGDLAYLRTLADEAGFSTEVLSTQAITREGVRVEYFTFRMAPR